MCNQCIYLQDWYAQEYDSDRFGGRFGRYLHEKEVSRFLSLIDGDNGTVLDVGAGTGKLTLPLIRRCRPVVSIDLSPAMLAIAAKAADKDKCIMRSAISDAHHLCFRDRAFACVISSRVLMHLADWKGGISEFCRVSRDVLVLDFPPLWSFAGLHSMLLKLKRDLISHTGTYNAFSVRRIMKELQKHNFQVDLLYKAFFLPIAFHRWLDRPDLSWAIECFCKKLGLVRIFGAPVTLKAKKVGHNDPSGWNARV